MLKFVGGVSGQSQTLYKTSEENILAMELSSDLYRFSWKFPGLLN